ncbi:MAG TPA: dTDP-4-dehydrorhamnose 3,5-epimerase [Segetibacter sp.]|jgi:dTDP-4-dehydrorhamnose 3,5-epimerase
MRVEQTHLQGCFLIHDTFFEDERGYFFESFNAQRFSKETGVAVNFVQDNQSRSIKGTLRGLHFQTGEHAQAKLVRVLRGEVLDVAVDIRQSSPTFGQHYSVLLSETSRTQLFIPRGFAHGFLVLSDQADFFYKCDNYYNKAAEGGILFNDPALNIDWKMKASDLIISSKDKELPYLNTIKNLF